MRPNETQKIYANTEFEEKNINELPEAILRDKK